MVWTEDQIYWLSLIHIYRYHINVLPQDDIQAIDEKINSDFATAVTVDYKIVNEWLSQFLPSENDVEDDEYYQ